MMSIMFRLAFPHPDAVVNLAVELASAVSAGATLRLWLHAPTPELALLPWEYLCLTEGAVGACCQQYAVAQGTAAGHRYWLPRRGSRRGG